ncbi:GAF domain-containing protein [Parahaliea mediterranea]|uniref:GAF domain-containing protein n=1 Tax=Parahaliea mediterranea TaxID=651086 RepID=A0A939IL37_9GAMM|nr:GAF domain-containing protein [Parahaliea mediterranea]MBN7795572.1 GAF domain-containing protein [Parahaliea mediterranea]
MLPLEEARLQLRGLMAGEPDLVANAANFSAFLNEQLDNINWLGFYFLRGDELVLGPFQGRPACVRIPVGKGVCGAAVASGSTQVVADVHRFPGHIACDIRSRSEVVVPLWRAGEIVGVLDVDSPVTDRFSAAEVEYIEALARHFCELQFG